jgi:sugar-specific transcriptional regulator TrmB
MNIEELLQEFGLTPTETRLYLTALRYQHISASDLSKKTSIKRPAVYHALETLEKKGLIATIGTARVLRYKAEPPEQLKSLLERKRIELTLLEKKINASLSFFPVEKDTAQGEVRVEFFRGIEAVKNLAEKSLANKGREIMGIIPSPHIFTKTFGVEFMSHYTRIKTSRGISSWSVWASECRSELDAKEFIRHKEFLREIRIAPEHLKGTYPSIILIWDENVAIINTGAEVFGVLIASKEYTATMKMLWSLLWNGSKTTDSIE